MTPEFREDLKALGQACDQVIAQLPTQAMRDRAFLIFQRLAAVLTRLAAERGNDGSDRQGNV